MFCTEPYVAVGQGKRKTDTGDPKRRQTGALLFLSGSHTGKFLGVRERGEV